MKLSISIVVILLTLQLAACGGSGNSVDLPPERKASSVSGATVDNILVNSVINIYSYEDKKKGALLASSSIDSQGFFDIPLKEKSQPIIIEATAGTYKALASGEEIAMQEDQVISTFANYETEKPLVVSLSPVTHLASSLMQYKMLNGEDFSSSMNSSAASFKEIFELDIFSSPTTTEKNKATEFSEETVENATHKIVLNALSGFSNWFAKQNGRTDNTTYNLAELTAIMAKDILADGLLDGIAIDEENNPIQLALGKITLNANVYRMGLASHISAYLKSSENTTSFTDADLLPLAKTIAKSEAPLFGTEAVDTVPALSPKLTYDWPNTVSVQGEIRLRVDAEEFVDIERISIYVDDKKISDVSEQELAAFELDTNEYPDGEYTIKLVAVDVFGNESTTNIAATFNNTSRIIFNNISLSTNFPLITNEENLAVSGNYTGDDIASISVNDVPMSVLEDGTWSGLITLVSGVNSSLVKIRNSSGYEEELSVTLILDDEEPIIDTFARSQIKYSAGGGNFSLENNIESETTTLLYFESDKLDLNGIPETREALTNNNIPFFGFIVTDKLDGINETPLDELQVELSYIKNGVKQGNTKRLTVIDGEYLIPLTTETLQQEWYQTIPSDVHVARVRVTDIAGNIRSTDFSFSADIYVPELVMDEITELPQNTSFTDRGDFIGSSFESGQYSFKNTTGKSYYIRLQDESNHEMTRFFDEKIRKHLIKTITTREWQVGEIENFSVCPEKELVEMKTVTSISSYDNANDVWIQRYPSQIDDELFEIFTDTRPTDPAASEWTDVLQDFGGGSKEVSAPAAGGLANLFYEIHLISENRENSPIKTSNWRFESGTETINCNDVSFFQERLTYENKTSEGYPRNEITPSEQTQENTTFQTEFFTVVNEDTQTEIPNNSGWYLIPTNSLITINKTVKIPDITLYDDSGLFEDDFTASYDGSRYDKELIWSINKSIVLESTINAGSENLGSNSLRTQTIGEGISNYTISRDN